MRTTSFTLFANTFFTRSQRSGLVLSAVACAFVFLIGVPHPAYSQTSTQSQTQTQLSVTDSLVTAALSQASISFGDSVALTVTAKNIDKAINLAPLERDFHVNSQSSSREVRFINGVETTTSNWVMQIEPKRTGVLTVPPIFVGTYSSRALALNVGDAPSGAERDVFIEATVDTETPYVQSQVLMTVKVWQSVNVLDSSKVNRGSDQFTTVALERDREYRDTLDGKDFLVQEQQFALFPQASGVHTFGPIELRAQIPLENTQRRGLFAPTRSITRLSNPITLNVQPRPDNTQGKWWLPASDVQILDSWSADRAAIDANEPLTRTIEVIATGVSVKQLPDMVMPTIDGVKLYSDNVERTSSATDAGLVSRQKITWVVVPQVNGTVNIPPVSVGWFNTTTGEQSVAQLPATTLNVSGVLQETAPLVSSPNSDTGSAAGFVNADGQTLPPLPSSDAGFEHASTTLNNPLFWVVLGALALLLLQGIGFLIYRIRNDIRRSFAVVAPSDEDGVHVPSLRKVCTAINGRKLSDVQQAVLDWAALFWPRTPPQSLLNVAQRIGDPELERVFRQIDASLYGATDSDVDLSRIEAQLKHGASRLVDARQTVIQGSQLPSL